MKFTISSDEFNIILKHIKKKDDANWPNFLKVVEEIRSHSLGFPAWPDYIHRLILEEIGNKKFDLTDPTREFDIIEKYIEEIEDAWRNRKLN